MLVADFDGLTAMLDALAYLKAARSWSVPVALEVSRSGVGAHAWVFFTAPVPAESARGLGTALLREAMAVRGHMDLASYDRLFPSQDVLPAGGVGNLIAAPLHGGSRADGTTVFLDLATMEPFDDQWAFLSMLGRMSPAEVTRVARKAGRISVGTSIDRIGVAASTRIRVAPPSAVHARLAAGIRVETEELPRRCTRHSSTRRPCPTLSSTNASDCECPPGTLHGSCAATTRPWTAGSSCPAG